MKVVIVGGVAGGAGAAARLRRNNESAEIILFERGEHISFANCGLPYYIGGVIDNEDELLIQTPEGFSKRFNVDVRTNSEVIALDAAGKRVTVKNLKNNETYSENFDKLILSPGAKPIRLPIKGANNDNVFTLRSIPDANKIKEFIEKNDPKTAAVIGGGYIGLEMADNLYRAGIRTSIIEAMPHVMNSLDIDMAHRVHNHIRDKGVDLYLNSRATEIKDNNVILEDGRSVPAELIIMSVGIAPETNFLRNSGIELGEKGEIIVNDRMQTSLLDIYAVGDAAGIMNFVSGKRQIIPLASPANKQARIVADVVCGIDVKYTGAQGTAIAKVFDMTVAVTGENEETLKNRGAEYVKSITVSSSNATYYPGGDTMYIKLLFENNGKILGAQITGFKGVDKRIDVLATAIRAKMTVFDLQELELAYAPPYSSAKDPVNMAGYVAGNILAGTMKPFYIEDLPNLPEDALLIDVRTRGEYNMGHIEGAINIPLDEIRENLNSIDKNKKIFVYCRIAQRAYIAERILTQAGFNVSNLAGGYLFYEQQKLDVTDKEAMAYV